MENRGLNSECFSRYGNGVFVTSPGASYRDPVSYSHYNQPLESGGIRGNSRLWGDASFETQNAAINQILEVGKKSKLTNRELAFALSVARVESGFNPDAAAGTTSASGIGQLIDSTAERLGVKSEKRFDLKENVQGFIKLLRNTLETSKRDIPKGSELQIFQRAYALYHDGPSLSYGGSEIAKQKVLPNLERMLSWVNCTRQQ
jgi:putative chitinase